ncbi:uncharacterized protein CDAR_118651 [Caerostris darwini]|uniref:Uncharacterized protein n=1 Tax=Caerostris darwini TaxID=1538125 RepID=A0AAV4X1I4_9ARAC|nr:uncharacterized protein CDAR_118651 [Caerostris darwini]
MVSPLLIFVLFAVAVQSSPTSYQPFNAIKQISDIGNNLDPLLETANRKALQNNKILDCDMEEILKTVGLNELQNLIEAVASRKGTNPFAIMKMLYKRMKSHEEIEENLMISLDGIPLPDLSSSPVIETPPQAKIPPGCRPHPLFLTLKRSDEY